MSDIAWRRMGKTLAEVGLALVNQGTASWELVRNEEQQATAFSEHRV